MIENPASLNILKEKSLPSMNLLFQLHDIWGIDVIRVKRVNDLYKAFTNTSSISATHLIDLYGVKYITSVTPLDDNNKFELVYARLEGLEGKREDLLKENTIKIYRNRNPLPRAWVVKDFKVLDPQAMLQLMIQKEFRPGQEVLLEEEPQWTNPPTPPFTKGGVGGLLNVGEPSVPARGRQGLPKEVEIISEDNNKLGLRVKAAENAVLVLSDTYYPDWKAFVDGKKTKIYRADYNFRAIPLNAGTHRVEFVYDPLSFKLGAGATILGILGCIGIGWVARRRRTSNHKKCKRSLLNKRLDPLHRVW
jgi:hypothetical protein